MVELLSCDSGSEQCEPPIEDDYVSNPLLRIPTEQCSDGIYQCAVFDAGSESRVKRVPLPEDKMTIFELTRKIVDVNQVLAKLWIFNFDVNQETDKNGDYLIHIATKNGESQMPLLELLVKCYDADVNLQDKDGYTCLMIAANMGNTLIVEILVRCLKADPDVRHPVTGRTAIHYASQRNYLDVVSVLVKYGANYSIEDNDGILADELALVYHANECHRFINTHRTQRMNHLVSLIAQDCLKKEDVQASDLYLTDADGYTLITAAARMNSCHSLDWLIREPRAPINAQHEKLLNAVIQPFCTNSAGREGYSIQVPEK
ncbi:hypothetical protein LSH36_730g00020 [Paralvinella palmiformis]|uniref:Uncharacterized protein n=1 Tax=Paralvinella palmiformis TaxID=53620 RepID=A0AAD9MVR6_9ANNE|nr:hypothetical protein LSH36_730g00020 [Paralvinella palmiformis]